MKLKLLFISCLFVFTSIGLTQNTESRKAEWELFPSGLNFMPLRANYQEARVQVLYYTATSNLKVDIGNTVDLISLKFPEKKIKFAASIEFMAYAFSTSYAGKRLQIDAIDGFFGGNISFSKQFEKNKLLSRFRIIHNSAHFVDGHYNNNTNEWIDGREPNPFTKDFGEVTVAHEINFERNIFKYYGGLSYASLVRPENLKRWNFHYGFEYAFLDLFGRVLGKDSNLFFAYHFILSGDNTYEGNNHLKAGIKLGIWNNKGITLFSSYYSGRDVFSSYLGKRISKFGVGFSVEFF